MPTVKKNMALAENSGFSGAAITANPLGKLKTKPITNPCIVQCFILNRLMPIAKPINVRLSMMLKAINSGNSCSLDARLQHTIPDNRPNNVAIANLFIFSVF